MTLYQVYYDRNGYHECVRTLLTDLDAAKEIAAGLVKEAEYGFDEIFIMEYEVNYETTNATGNCKPTRMHKLINKPTFEEVEL